MQALDGGQILTPLPESNQADAAGQRTAQADARLLYEQHVRGLQARRQRDLISELVLLRIDGSGDFQWADIYNGQRVEIPLDLSPYRKTENLLRPIVDNAVAHHTTIPYRFFAESPPDRRSVEKALIDTIWANYLSQCQDFNGLAADVMYLAMAAGFGLAHAYWRAGQSSDWYEAVGPGQIGPDPTQGMIDAWCGNPFGTVFDPAARRGSVRWCSYERVVAADDVRRAFGHMRGVAGIEGSTRIPSAAEFQLIAKDWQTGTLGLHGDPTMAQRRLGRESAEELMVVVCRETAPGVLASHPQGRLQLIAMPGHVDTRQNKGNAASAVLLADQALPGGDYSWSIFHSHARGMDIHGKPWPEDLLNLQMDLNLALSARWEHTQKLRNSPIVTPGAAIADDMMDVDGYSLLEVDPSIATWRPRVMEWPQGVLLALNNEIEEKRRALYTIGGYQASSRGEAPGSRMAYRAILALQQADKTVHTPVNMRHRRSMCDFMRRCWRQMKTYGDVPWLVDITGDEYAHLVDGYVDNGMLSEDPPRYKLVSAFGPSPELLATEMLELVQIVGADGVPFLETEEARKQYPNQAMFGNRSDPRAVKMRRAKVVASKFHTVAREYRQMTGLMADDPNDPALQEAAFEVFVYMDQRFKRLRDDDVQAQIDALSEITQDEQADPLARMAAAMRQDMYYEVQAQMYAGYTGMPTEQGQAAMRQPGSAGGAPQLPSAEPGMNGQSVPGMAVPQM